MLVIVTSFGSAFLAKGGGHFGAKAPLIHKINMSTGTKQPPTMPPTMPPKQPPSHPPAGGGARGGGGRGEGALDDTKMQRPSRPRI